MFQKTRKQIIEERLYLLSIEQLERILAWDQGPLCHDESNYEKTSYINSFCPLAVAFEVPELLKKLNLYPTNTLVAELTKFKGVALFGPSFELSPTKGIEGNFYHGTNAERDRDLRQVIRKIIKIKKIEEERHEGIFH